MSGPESLEFRVLGPMALEVGGRSVALPGIRPRRLLACLALHVGRSASVASLIDAVWGDDPPVVDRGQRLRPEIVELVRSIQARAAA